MNIPDRLSIERGSPFFDWETAKKIEIYFKDIRQMNCIREYCISEGWIIRVMKTAHGQTKTDGKGNALVMRFEGPVRVELKAPFNG